MKMIRFRSLLAVVGVTALLGIMGCSSDQATPDPTEACNDIPLKPLSELLIIDDAVLGDERALNQRPDGSAGPWSFRNAIENMVPPGMTSSQLISEWLVLWSKNAQVNLEPLSARPLVRSRLACPWLQRTPSNACNDDCSSCAAEEYDLAEAPFRLLAIAYRPDLRAGFRGPGGGAMATGDAGEGRLVFGMTAGAGDDPAAKPLALAAIFEYGIVGAPKETAEAWHSLGEFDTFDDGYKAALERVTDRFVKRGMKPGAVSENSLLQIRTNEREFDWQWEFRDFKLRPDGLRLAPLANTPFARLNGADLLRDYLRANKDVILAERHNLPPDLQAGVIHQGFKWHVDDVDEPVRKAFAKHTCNGCHMTEAQPVDVNFHISPLERGRVSTFLFNPADREHDDVALRERAMRDALCGH